MSNDDVAKQAQTAVAQAVLRAYSEMPGYLIHANHPAYPPVEVVAAANVVGQWFDKHLIKGWQLGPCADRSQLSKDALDAARYRAWRAAVLNDDDDFIVNVGRALPEREKDDTLDSWEWDRAIDAAIAGSKA